MLGAEFTELLKQDLKFQKRSEKGLEPSGVSKKTKQTPHSLWVKMERTGVKQLKENRGETASHFHACKRYLHRRKD